MTARLLAAIPIALGSRRILAPGRLRWLRAFAWMVALFFLVLFAFAPLMHALQAVLPRGDARIGFLVNAAGAAAALAAYLLLVRLGEDRLPAEIAPAPALVQLPIGLVIGAAMFACVMAIMAAAGIYRVEWHGLAPAWGAAGSALRAGVTEEILVRAIMLRLLWRAFGPAAAFIVSALFFGAAHLANSGATLFAALCVALEAGVMLGAFYALTGRLWVSIGAHVAWNFTQGYAFGAAVSGTATGSAIARSIASPTAPSWATGGAFGPEASLPALLVCTSVGLAALWLAYKGGRFDPTEPAAA